MNRCALLAAVVLSSASVAAVKPVTDFESLRVALAGATAGDVIELADGTYALTQNLTCSADGTPTQPVTVRARNPLQARLEVSSTEGFKVSGRHWVFEGLELRGVCASDAQCEHAFHVTGDAVGFTLRDSRVLDFNAQLKVNATATASGWEVPHRGLIERSELADTRPRNTSSPVTKLNIDTGDDWVVRDNLIRDFQKQGGDGVSYGAFMKSGGARGVFERNLVLCARDVVDGGTRIGLSFGGGGTGPAFCAPAFDAGGVCDPEHSEGIVRNNIVARCSDVAVYLNKAARTQVLFNTFIDTAGVDFRFASSTGWAHGNFSSAGVRGRDQGRFDGGENRLNELVGVFSSLYAAPLEGDLTVTGDAASLIGSVGGSGAVMDDYCGRPRPAVGDWTVGALEHSLGNCETRFETRRFASEADAGAVAADASVPPLGPADGGEVLGPAQGCGCNTTALPWAGAALVLLALLGSARRRGPQD